MQNTNYSIKELEVLTGVKAHTIRIWEQRYQILTPHRTDTNIRKYSEHDLKKLISISILNNNGFKISSIANFPEDEIQKKALIVSELDSFEGSEVDPLTIAMLELDELKFEKTLNTYIKKIGFEKTLKEVVNPFLEKLIYLWLTNSINQAQEYFTLNIIRQKIISGIDKLPLKEKKGNSKFILYLPNGEYQELHLLYISYLLKKHHHKVHYLGQNINLSTLKISVNQIKPDYVLTFIAPTYSKTPIENYVRDINEISTDVKIVLTGFTKPNTSDLNNLISLPSLKETEEFIINL